LKTIDRRKCCGGVLSLSNSIAGMMTEVLTKYGPVNRLWFDGLNMGVVQKDMQSPTVYKPYYDSMFELIRKVSPDTLISGNKQNKNTPRFLGSTFDVYR
jgi:hypothetical protein